MKEKLIEYKTFLISSIIILLGALSFYMENFFIGTVLLFFLLIFNYYKDVYKNDNEEIVQDIIAKLKLNMNDNISNMSYPIALINKSGDIIWGNKKLKLELIDEELKGQNILAVARNLDMEKLLKCDKDLSQRLKIKDCFYSIYANKINDEKINDEDIYMVYFIEVSNLRDLYSTKESIMLIEVDNLSEVLERTDDINRPMLIAEIEKAINAYAQKLKAMIVKYESNKYVLSVQDKYINDEINNKFEILEVISSIDIGNKLEVTLSIGIGRGGVSPQENFHYAVTAKELALGRGGDQVAVKSNEKIKFFGGNSREVEKRTRVRARVISQAIKELIFDSSNIFIIGHKNPDMDCLGASVGMWATIKQLGKNCNIILENDTNAIDFYLSKLKSSSKYDNMFINGEEAEKLINEKSLLIIVDVHNKGYVQNYE